KVSGMLQYVTPAGLVHHTLNHRSTNTGRLNSARPNSQNFSGGKQSQVQTVFTSRFGDKGRILSGDFSGLEVVVLAALSGDTHLKEVLAKGTDMHCLRLSK